MKRVIALFLSAILLVSLSVPAFAAEPQQSNRIHAALDTPEFKSAYKDLQVVNEIIEEVPNSNICYIYHDLSDGNSISYMLKNNKVVYKAYVVTKEHKVTEYNYSEDGTCVASTNVCNGVQREHNKKLNNGLPILHKVPPKRDYGRYFCIMAEKGGTSHGGLTEKLSLFFHAKKQEVNAYGR